MNTSDIASQIANKVIAETSFWVALIGLIGAMVGAFITIAGNVLIQYLKDRPRRRLDNARKEILKRMLDDQRFPNRWRRLTTLSRVVGADEKTTKRLLIEIGARGSEKDDGLWGLVTNHPFKETDQ